MRTKLLLPLTLLLASGLSHATPVPPAGFLPDSGAQLWEHTSGVIAAELFDFGESSPPAGGWSFGFYFATDPNTLITIFDSSDAQNTSFAFIDFTTGSVYDIDEATPQDTFVPSADPIGFWLALDSDLVYTESGLNAGLIDPAFDFQSASEPLDHLIGFDIGGGLISFQFLSGIRAIVPAPGTLALIGLGLLVAGAARRR